METELTVEADAPKTHRVIETILQRSEHLIVEHNANVRAINKAKPLLEEAFELLTSLSARQDVIGQELSELRSSLEEEATLARQSTRDGLVDLPIAGQFNASNVVIGMCRFDLEYAWASHYRI